MTNLSTLQLAREEIISQITNSSCYDLLVIGGGIHGATLARLAAEAGLCTLLLEKNDYSSGTSSRSSKMAHGGLRYLELLDFQQVFEGVKAREQLLTDYPHLVKPQKFFIPVEHNDWFFRCKLGIGLKLYDLMLSNHQHRHRWINKKNIAEIVPELGTRNFSGCYQYTDGMMNDFRLVQENIQRARLAGASCLNYAEVLKVNKTTTSLQINWTDSVLNKSYQTQCKIVANCAGPWIQDFAAVPLKFSRGSHLIFSHPWKAPALFLPMAGKSRYYFVWPHFAGTMVGTTEREVVTPDFNPVPSADEIEEILARLAKDLPASNLNRQTLHYAFAGVRTLPLRSAKQNSAQLSRKHLWIQQDQILSLAGGKYTTAEWTAREGLNILLKNLKQQPLHTAKIHYPQLCLPDVSVAQAFQMEQAVYLEDYLTRRSGLSYQQGNGLDQLSKIQDDLEKFINKEQLAAELITYQQKINQLKALLT